MAGEIGSRLADKAKAIADEVARKANLKAQAPKVFADFFARLDEEIQSYNAQSPAVALRANAVHQTAQIFRDSDHAVDITIQGDAAVIRNVSGATQGSWEEFSIEGTDSKIEFYGRKAHHLTGKLVSLDRLVERAMEMAVIRPFG